MKKSRNIVLCVATILSCFTSTVASFSAPQAGSEKSVRLGDTAPNFTAETQQGPLNFYEWSKNSWVVLMSHPKSFTPVCSTELAAAAGLVMAFAGAAAAVAAVNRSVAASE